MDALAGMGLVVEMGHHEVALGQHEIDFKFDEALRTADNVLTLKYTVKAIAAQHDLVASFMPKPIFGINGSGMHCHQSIFDQDGKNLFFDPDDKYNLSRLAYGFIGGQLANARALSSIVAPTVNSYKRLVPGYEAPVYVGWAQINRSALIRIPRYTSGRVKSMGAELRCPDPSSLVFFLSFLIIAVTWNWIYNIVSLILGHRLTCNKKDEEGKACGAMERRQAVQKKTGQKVTEYVCANGHKRPDAHFHPVRKGMVSHTIWLVALTFCVVVFFLS